MADNDNVAPICTGELHLHNDHSSGASCHANPELMDVSASKGKRLVVSLAVAPDGPLCEQDPIKEAPHDDFMWKGDVPHGKEFDKRDDNEQLTC